MGKYDKVLKNLKRLQPEDLERQERIDQLKEKLYDNKTASELAALFVSHRKEKKQIDGQLSLLNLHIDAISQLMESAFEDENMSSITIGNTDTVRMQPEPYAKVEDRDKLRNWCMKDPDLQNQLTLPWMTINAITKDNLLKGDDAPPGVEPYFRNKFVYTSKG